MHTEQILMIVFMVLFVISMVAALKINNEAEKTRKCTEELKKQFKIKGEEAEWRTKK